MVALTKGEYALLIAFLDAPQHHYLIRSVDPVDPPLALPHVVYVTGRGPFSEADDRALMLGRDIEILIAKNSGGTASYGKIAAGGPVPHHRLAQFVVVFPNAFSQYGFLPQRSV